MMAVSMAIPCKKRDNTYCCVPQCYSRGSKNPELSFHRFPNEKHRVVKYTLNNTKTIAKRRDEWRRILRVGKPITPRMTVCSLHFKKTDFNLQNVSRKSTLRPTAVPSENLPLPLAESQEKRSLTAQKIKKRKKTSEINRREDRSPSDSSKICSCHFIDKEKCNGPTIFPWNAPTMEKKNAEYISCSIPGCKSKFFRKMKDFIANANGEDVLMFPVPHADEQFNKWKEALKQTNLELSKDDHICEKHFLEIDIERYCRTKNLEGNIEITEQLPTLKYNAVPIKFLKPPFPISNSPVKPPVCKNDVMIKSKNSITDQLNSNSSAPVINTTVTEMEIADDSSANLIQSQTTPKKDCMPYEKLAKYIQRVKRPSKSWSVVCTDQFILFAKWNNKFIAEKRLVIESSLTIRVFLKEWEIEMTDLVDITSADDVSSLLEKVENYKI